MGEAQPVGWGDLFVFGLCTYGALVAAGLHYIYKNPHHAGPGIDMDVDEDEPSVPAPSRPAKRKAHPRPPEASEECVRDIRGFLRTGVPGMKELAKVYPAIRKRYHADDPEGWADSCNAAFSGYGRDIQRRLEECEWELDRMDPCELWFVY
jgi:hypothetical protein